MPIDVLTSRLSRLLRHTRNRDTPIRINRVVQTGANNQLGGVKKGLFRVAYQVGIEGDVKTEPMKPANWQMTRLITNLRISNTLIFPIS